MNRITSIAFELAGDTDRQAFMSELVEHVEHPLSGKSMPSWLPKATSVLPEFTTRVR
jgi:hypothetical protein